MLRELTFAGLMSLVGAPCAAASEAPACETNDARGAIEEPATAPPPPTARPTVAQREPAPVRVPPRRRNGKPIPDAELIGPRGAL